MNKEKDVRKLINWAELSRRLTGSKDVIRNTYVPVRYKETINKLIDKLSEWNENK